MNPPEQFLPLTETVTPADPAAVAETVRGAWQSGTPVYPIGGGTALHYGVRPTRPGLGLSLARLNRVIDYPARDLTITVEAGATIAEVAGRLASERQRLPVDIPQADLATVGGAVATDPSGPRRYLWRTLRDYVIGIQAVDGRGTAFSGGGRVVKNAAGYNLCRLLTGSLGTLGVITQVTLMVKPVPETSALLARDVSDLATAEKLLADLVHTQTLPAAIDFLVGPAWEDDPALSRQSASAAGRLVVGFEGTSAEVDWMLEHLGSDWRGSTGVSAAEIRGDASARVWDRLTQFPAPAPGADGAGRGVRNLLCVAPSGPFRQKVPDPFSCIVVEIGVLPSATVDFVRLLLEVDPDCSIQAHAGDGILRVRFARDPAEAAAVLGGRLRPAVAAAGGSMVVLSCPVAVSLSRNDVWGPDTNGAVVMQSIKSGFDPKGILNPDRFAYPNP